jgi:drug/metabolite transporter (DMT)-like permease
VVTLLTGRFLLAAVLLWALVAWRRPALPAPRVALAALALGAVAYAGEASLYFSALARLDASLVAMLLATYPVLVVAAAVALGRERPDRRRAIALAVAIAGAALVLGGAQIGALSGPGLMFAGSATVAYATYVLLADRFVARVDGLLLAALVTTGAGIGTLSFGAATGSLDPASLQTGGWAAIVLLAVVCTVVPISSFLLALPRVGPGTASILSTFETVVGVGLAALLLGESLGALQAAGAALVVGSVVALQLGQPTRVSRDEPAAVPAAPSAARALAEQPA